MNIIIFKGMSQYDVLSTFTLMTTQEFRKLGINAVTVDMNLINGEEYLRFHDQFKPDFTMGYNPVTYFYENQQNHIMKTDTPHILRIGDHPYYHINNRAMLDPNHPKLLTLTTEKYFEYTFKELGVTRYEVTKSLPGVDVSHQVQLKDKTIPVTYFGTYLSLDQIIEEMRNNFAGSPKILDILMSFCADLESLLIFNQKYIQSPIELLLDQYIKDTIQIEQTLVNQIIEKSFLYIDRFHRNLTRKIALIAIAETGIPLLIFSNPALREILQKFSNVVFCNPVSYLESLHIIGQSKANINITPMFTSLHERLPNSYVNSSILLSNRMLDFSSNNPDLSNGTIFFDQHNIEESVQRLNEIISNETMFNEITQMNYEVATKKYSFENEFLMLKEMYHTKF